jgi:hypothetical protein
VVLDEFVGKAAADRGETTAQGSPGTIVRCTILEEFVSGTPAPVGMAPPNGGARVADLAAQVARQFGIPPATALELVQYIWDRATTGLPEQA